MRIFANMSIRNKLLLGFFLVALIPSIIVFLNSYKFSVMNVERISLNISQTAVEQTSKLIDNFLDICENTCLYIAGDDEIQGILAEKKDPEIFLRSEKEINNKLMELHKQVVPEAYSIYVIGENGFQFKSITQKFGNNNLNKEMFYWKAFNSDSAYWDGPKKGSWALQSTPDAYLTVGRRVYDKNDTPVGIVAIEIRESVIADMLHGGEDAKGQAIQPLSMDFICLVDKSFRVVSHTDKEKLGTQMPSSIVYSQDTEAEKRYNSDYLVVSRPVGERWFVMGATYLPELSRQSAETFSGIILVFLSSIILAILLALVVSAYIAKPIQKLTGLMQQVEHGNMDARIKMKYFDEIGTMGRVFNSMLDQLCVSMERIRDNEKRLMILQYDILREQIKPHFMYNTLDSLRWLARDGRTDDVERMTISLMKFYRIHLNNGEDVIRLEEEIEHAKNYLVIQKMRYHKEILDYRLDVPKELMNCRMLKLTLQPLIENAIYHGLRNSPTGGTITITVEHTDEEIVFCVEDTGVGMNSEGVENLNNMMQSRNEKIGYGLRNVNERLKLMFGSQYGLWLESMQNVGTKVFVKVPRIEYEEE